MDTPPLHHWRELNDEGLTRNSLNRLLREDELSRIRRGVFTDPTPAPDNIVHTQLIHATLPLLSAEAVVSHQSAAILLGLPYAGQPPNRVHVTRLTGSNGRSRGCLTVHKALLSPDEITDVGGVPVTTLARTAVDLARDSSYEWGVIAMDAALRLGASREELGASVLQCGRMWGVTRARAALDFADGRSESPLESVSRVHFSRMGIPMPEPQFVIRTPSGQFVARADFGWKAERLVGEADGMIKYGELLRPGQTAIDAVRSEKAREQAIRDQGFWVVRWGSREAWDLPVLTKLITNALRRAA